MLLHCSSECNMEANIRAIRIILTEDSEHSIVTTRAGAP